MPEYCHSQRRARLHYGQRHRPQRGEDGESRGAQVLVKEHRADDGSHSESATVTAVVLACSAYAVGAKNTKKL